MEKDGKIHIKIMNNTENSKCELCGCKCELTQHHLIPKVRAKKKYKYIRDDDSNIIMICRPCHDFIHATWSENELRDLYNTKDKLLAAPEMQKFIAWKIKHPDFAGHSKMSNQRKHR